jgi:hypothetical protein
VKCAPIAWLHTLQRDPRYGARPRLARRGGPTAAMRRPNDALLLHDSGESIEFATSLATGQSRRRLSIGQPGPERFGRGDRLEFLRLPVVLRIPPGSSPDCR